MCYLNVVGKSIPKMKAGEKFELTGFPKLEDMYAGDWKISRLGEVQGKPTYVMQSAEGGELIQHFTEDIDDLCDW